MAAPEIRFAIVTSGREGSTYLERLLASHPQAACPGEIFSPAAFESADRDALEARLRDQVDTQPVKAAGFKLSMQDVFNHPELLGIVKRRRYRLIRLRRNLLDHFLSGRLAIANNAWTSDEPSKGIMTVETTAEELQAHFTWSNFATNILREATSELLALDIAYEELVRPDAFARICDFLEIEAMPLLPRSERQHPQSQRQKLVGYDNHKQTFAATRWAELFLD